eukprot:m.838997 g.838997  ORF g.838997 m.838997 type:complete len:686 (-) comp59501_c0_seq6:53-2110(-)
MSSEALGVDFSSGDEVPDGVALATTQPIVSNTTETRVFQHKRPRKNQSNAYKHSTVRGNQLCCNYCSTMYQFDAKTRMSTHNMRLHLGRCHPSLCPEFVSPAAPTTTLADDRIGPSDIRQFVALKPTEKAHADRLDALLQFVIASMLPLSIIDNPHFHRLLHAFDKRFQLPSSKTFQDVHIPALWVDVRSSVTAALNTALAVSLTINRWTSRGRIFVAVTAHCVNAMGRLNSHILALRNFDEPQAAQDLDFIVAETLDEFVEDWDERKLITACTTDGAANMLQLDSLSSRSYSWVRCFARLLNSLCKDFFAEADLGDTLDKLRRLYEVSRRSRAFLALWPQNTKRLIRDSPTHCLSTLCMLQRALELQAPLSATLQAMKLSAMGLSDEQWSAVGVVTQILEPIQRSAADVSLPDEVTISIPVAFLQSLEKRLQASSDAYSAILLRKLQRRKAQYLKNCSVPSMAAALDPRFRTVAAVINPAVEEQIRERLRAVPVVPKLPTLMQQQPTPAPPTRSESKYDYLQLGAFLPGPPADEWDLYRSEIAAPLSANPLAWWLERSDRYPVLHKIALSILSTQATESRCERALSKAESVWSPLGPSTLRLLLLIWANHPVLRQNRVEMREKREARRTAREAKRHGLEGEDADDEDDFDEASDEDEAVEEFDEAEPADEELDPEVGEAGEMAV